MVLSAPREPWQTGLTCGTYQLDLIDGIQHFTVGLVSSDRLYFSCQHLADWVPVERYHGGSDGGSTDGRVFTLTSVAALRFSTLPAGDTNPKINSTDLHKTVSTCIGIRNKESPFTRPGSGACTFIIVPTY